MPSLSIAGCIFMVIAACFAHRMAIVWYLVIIAVIMAVGALFARSRVTKSN